nr:hypothetical protein CFP56_30140 [Quercus suber]
MYTSTIIITAFAAFVAAIPANMQRNNRYYGVSVNVNAAAAGLPAVYEPAAVEINRLTSLGNNTQASELVLDHGVAINVDLSKVECRAYKDQAESGDWTDTDHGPIRRVTESRRKEVMAYWFIVGGGSHGQCRADIYDPDTFLITALRSWWYCDTRSDVKVMEGNHPESFSRTNASRVTVFSLVRADAFWCGPSTFPKCACSSPLPVKEPPPTPNMKLPRWVHITHGLIWLIVPS